MVDEANRTTRGRRYRRATGHSTPAASPHTITRMSGSIRKYIDRKDKKAVIRIWQECGWISDEKREADAFGDFLRSSDAWVFDMDGSAECLVVSTDGRFHHTETPLKLSAITGVTTSRVARNQRAASATLAACLADRGASGAHVSGLGVFEQGFYDRFGYGNGTYEHSVRFDPAWLIDLGRPRVPVRLTPKDWKAIHAGRLARKKGHGAVDLLPPEITKAEMDWVKSSFGLGYKVEGKLTHFFVASDDNKESGPYGVHWMVYQTYDQFKELMGLIRGLGDQVRQVRMREPRDIQIQSLLRKPFQMQKLSRDGKYQNRVDAAAYWQLRIMDVPACIAALSVLGRLEFNLVLEDPIQELVPDDAAWNGCGGSYVVTLCETSSAVHGHSPNLPELSATVNDFTQFWMGSASAEVARGWARRVP